MSLLIIFIVNSVRRFSCNFFFFNRTVAHQSDGISSVYFITLV